MTTLTRHNALASIGLGERVALKVPPSDTGTRAQPSRVAWECVMAALRQADADAERANQSYYRARDTYSEITGDEKLALARDSRADRLTGLGRAGDVSDEAMDRLADAHGAVILTPAPNNAALLWKIEFLGFTSSYCDEWAEAVLADARRLLGEGRT